MAKTVREQLGVDLPDPEENRVQPYAGTPTEPEESAQDERPEWLPENFKSAEAFVESYKSLESRLTTEAEERRSLQAQIGELSELVQQQNQYQQTQYQTQYQDEQTAQLYAAYEQDPIGTMAWLAQNAAQAAAQNVAQQFNQRDPATEAAQAEMFAATLDRDLSATYGDWEQAKTGVAEVLNQMPHLLPENPTFEQAKYALSTAYNVAKANQLASQQQVQNDGRAAKIAAQTMTGATGRQQSPDEGAERFARMQAALRGSSYSAARGGSF